VSGPWEKYREGPWSKYAAPQEQEEPVEQLGVGTSAIRGIGAGLLDMALGIPDAVARRGIETMFPPPVMGQDLRPQGVQDLLNQQRVLPLPRGEELMPGMEESQQQNPMATSFGQLAGEGVGLMLGRGMAKGGAGGSGFIPKATEETGAYISAIGAKLTENPGMARAISDQFKRGVMHDLARAAGKAAETSLEGAAVAMLQGGDPLEMAAYSAGAQVIGSAMLAPSHGLFSGGALRAGLKIGLAAAATMSVIQIAKSGTPGGDNRILESIETGYDKVLFAIALGGLSAAAGMGRVPGKNLPMLTDAVTAIPRGATLSILQSVLNDREQGVDTTERALTALATNPMQFNKSQRAAMERGLTDGSFGDTVNRLIERDPRFAARLDGEPVNDDFLTRGQRKKLNEAAKR